MKKFTGSETVGPLTPKCKSVFGNDLVDVVLLAERVEDDVDLVEHVHHLHGRDVDADLVELDHVAEQDGHIWEDLGRKQTTMCALSPAFFLVFLLLFWTLYFASNLLD